MQLPQFSKLGCNRLEIKERQTEKEREIKTDGLLTPVGCLSIISNLSSGNCLTQLLAELNISTQRRRLHQTFMT